MSTWILLLRGVNVGGKNTLPMKELVEELEALGLEGAQTYIQSGNVVFRAPGEVAEGLDAPLVDRIAEAVEARRGFRPEVMLLSRARLEEVIARNPYPEAEAEPSRLHCYFLAEAPEEPDVEALEADRAASERYELKEDAFYLHAPEGIGRSKLAGRAERHLGVPATARNWRTVMKLREMAEAR